MTAPPRTFSSSHLDRQRAAHSRVDGYGRHRHLYLHETIRTLARLLQKTRQPALKWLDYGCGKGGFIDQIRPLNLFVAIIAYDPAIAAFCLRPSGTYDLVTCLDILDIVESNYLGAVLQDIARFTAGFALFDCLTRPKPGTALRPHQPFYWAHLIRQHMDVVETRVEFPGMEGFERAVIVARPRAGAPGPAVR